MRAVLLAATVAAVLSSVLLAGSSRRVAHGASPDARVTLAVFRDGWPAGNEEVLTSRRGDTTVTSTHTSVRAGPGVEIRSTMFTAHDGTPLGVVSTGRSLPWLPAPVSWRRERDSAQSAQLPVHSPFPFWHLGMLARHWRSSGMPAVMLTARGDTLRASGCGRDSVAVQGIVRPLDCIRMTGLTWGETLVWLREDGGLAAAFVPSLVGKLQALHPDFVDARHEFMRIAARGAARLAHRTPPLMEASDRPIAIRGGSVLDVSTGRSISNAVVLLQGRRIVQVGRSSDVRIPRDARTLDARGATILPGLWDMHAHYRQVEWGPAYLAAGVTTARDVGNDTTFTLELRRLLRSGQGLGPDLLVAGWIDDTPRTSYAAYQARTPDDARSLVRAYHAAGFDQIKLWEFVSANAARAAIAEAHQRGLTVVGHVPQSMTLFELVDAGVDGVEHVAPLVAALITGPDSLRTPRALARYLRASGTVVDPTLVVAEFHSRDLGQPLSALEPGVDRVPADVARGNSGLRGPASDSVAGQRRVAAALQMVRALRDAGVPVVAGSDQGIPGYSLLRELELLAEAGLTPLEVIRAATLVPAGVMGLSDSVGTVAAGRRADLVIVDGNPLADLRALRRTRWVVRAGDVHDPAALRRSIGFTP